MPKNIGPNFPIIVTSYEVALNDSQKYLRHYKWKYVVVDEVRYNALANLIHWSSLCFFFCSLQR